MKSRTAIARISNDAGGLKSARAIHWRIAHLLRNCTRLAYAPWLRPGWKLRRRLRPLTSPRAAALPPARLARSLLSAGLAVLALDDFSRLPSRHSAWRARELLRSQWDIRSNIDCRQTVERRLARLGRARADEEAAFAAWRHGAMLGTEAFQTLQQVIERLCADLHPMAPGAIGRTHLQLLAWDAQQVAYIVRLGLRAEWLSAGLADMVLTRLLHTVRHAYPSWHDYSLSALVGMGMRGFIAPTDRASWANAAHGHWLFATSEHGPTAGLELDGEPRPSGPGGGAQGLSSVPGPSTRPGQ